MKARIFYVTVVILLPVVILYPEHNQAQTEPPLGPSCSQHYKRLAIPKIEQKYVSWCWAAVAQNIMASHKPELDDPPTRQCEIIKNVIMDTDGRDLDCCGSVANECMIESGWPEDVFNDPHYSFTYQPLTGWEKLNWTTATEEICQNRPFYSAINYLYGDAHVLVVTGYRIRRGQREIRVYDPIDDSHSFQSYDLFVGKNPNHRHLGDTFQIRPSP